MSSRASASAYARELNEAEIDHYYHNGWVKLDRLVDPGLVTEILSSFGRVQGGRIAAQDDLGDIAPVFDIYNYPSHANEFLRSFSHSRELARLAATLMRSRDRDLGGLSGEVRFLQDQILIKQPADKGGMRTPWHQDFNLLPVDRAGGLVIWIALCEIPPERGSMRFLSGSHNLPPLGRVFNTDGRDLVEIYPGLLRKFEMSPPLYLRPGDATVHDYCIVHSALENVTQQPRSSYVVEFIPAEGLYTGAPCPRTADVTLQVNQRLECEKFPLINI